MKSSVAKKKEPSMTNSVMPPLIPLLGSAELEEQTPIVKVPSPTPTPLAAVLKISLVGQGGLTILSQFLNHSSAVVPIPSAVPIKERLTTP
jgi:hypothetical protein